MLGNLYRWLVFSNTRRNTTTQSTSKQPLDDSGMPRPDHGGTVTVLSHAVQTSISEVVGSYMSKLGDVVRPVEHPHRTRSLLNASPPTRICTRGDMAPKGQSVDTDCLLFPFLSGQQPCFSPLRVVFETDGATAACTIRHDPESIQAAAAWLVWIHRPARLTALF